jgi:transglutaminase-like putative cysteine protease
MTTIPALERVFEVSLLGMMASGYFAVAGSGTLDPLTAFLTGAGLLWRLLQVIGRVRWTIPARWISWATFGYILLYPIDYLYFSDRDFVRATVHLVFFLAVIKILTASTERDYLYLKVLAFLELLAAAVVSVNLNFFFWLGIFLLFSIATFATSEVRKSAGQGERLLVRSALTGFGWRLTGATLFVAASVLLLAVALFFVLPRTTRAALQAWVDPRYHLSGFSNQVVLGQIGEIRMRREPVMHVRVEGNESIEGIKWRGAALIEFNGRAWQTRVTDRRRLPISNGVAQLADTDQLRRLGRRIAYEVQLRPTGADTVFVAGVPEFVDGFGSSLLQSTGTASLFSSSLSSRVVRYGARSFVKGDEAPGNAPAPDNRYLQLPSLDPRIAALAREWAGALGSPDEGATDEVQARELDRRLRTSYKYSIEPLEREVSDPLAYFLFDRGKGHCEYFASALAVMLRVEGIPSRVITGFQTGELNPVSGLYVVRASDAHSWVEAFIEGKGWITLDPTPAATQTDEIATLMNKASQYFDALETFWQDWVLSYDMEQQVGLAIRVDQARRGLHLDWLREWGEKLKAWGRWVSSADGRFYAVMVFLLVVAITGRFWVPRLAWWWHTRLQQGRFLSGKAKARDATVVYVRMLDFLRQRGYEKPTWVTPKEFAGMLAETPYGGPVSELTTLYYRVRYGADPALGSKLFSLLETLESSR